MGFLSDWAHLGHRRRRALLVSLIAAVTFTGAYGAVLGFLGSHHLDRHAKPLGIDFTSGSQIAGPLVIFMIYGFAASTFQGYSQWMITTFSNDPAFLAHLSGLVEALRGMGLALAWVIDAHNTSFMAEAAMFSGLTLVGLLLMGVTARLYVTDSQYGREDNVIVPEDFEKKPELFGVVHDRTGGYERSKIGKGDDI